MNVVKLPLEGVRILDSTYVVAMPYGGGVMTDLGAEVIKIEGPSHVDISRRLTAPQGADGDVSGDYWNKAPGFNNMNRGKRSLTLDMSRQEGRELFIELIKVSDIIMENFTPRVMKKWNLTYEDIKKIKPDIIMISNTGYGHSEGPYASYPGQATTMEATHGTASVTGYLNDIPSKAGMSFVDFLASWSGLFSVASALRYRNRTGKGQWIDIGMYQLGCYFLGEYILDWTDNKRLPSRIGNRHPQYAPQGCYPTSGNDDEWIVVSALTQDKWNSLCKAMDQQDLITDVRFIDNASRMAHHDELDEIISLFTKKYERFQLMEKLQGFDIPSGPVFDSRDYFTNSHNHQRGFIEKVTADPERNLGTRAFIARPWHLNKTEVKIKGFAPSFGEANQYVLNELMGIDNTFIQELIQQDVVNNIPTAYRKNTIDYSAASIPTTGGIKYIDHDYQKNLGIEI